MAEYIRITARRDGFRRAGMAHSREPQAYPVSDFSKEQLAQLESEPMLVCERVEGPEDGKADGGGQKTEDGKTEDGKKEGGKAGGKKK